MVSMGYFLSSEEFGPRELVRQARLAEQAGFERLWISDHYHPWNDEQGHSPFVWSVIGALSEATRLPVTTAVTCPTVRIHPAVIAQAAATAAVQHEGRFVLGVGSGEALNEHILGGHWPAASVRLEMLDEAIGTRTRGRAPSRLVMLPGVPMGRGADTEGGRLDRTTEVAGIVERITGWAAGRADVVGLLLVGSYARGAARPDSDVDLVLLTTDQSAYQSDGWAEELDLGEPIRTEAWGPILERRFLTRSNVEVEVGIGPPSWAAADPVDPGTHRVVTDGARVLHDPTGLLATLLEAAQRDPAT